MRCAHQHRPVSRVSGREPNPEQAPVLFENSDPFSPVLHCSIQFVVPVDVPFACPAREFVLDPIVGCQDAVDPFLRHVTQLLKAQYVRPDSLQATLDGRFPLSPALIVPQVERHDGRSIGEHTRDRSARPTINVEP